MPESMFKGDNGPHLAASESLTATNPEDAENPADQSEVESGLPGLGAAAALSLENGSS